jgi:hypothetical protein
MNKKYLLSFAGSIICCLVFGQSSSWSSSDYSFSVDKMQFKAQRVVPPSPDAADLGRYGNVPVSLFSGTPSINIPLYELKGNRISLPISVSYYQPGFRPQDIASWVGLGWSLRAGGVITRSVSGNPDNYNNYFRPNNHYGTPPVVNDVYANYDWMDSIRRGLTESQPDVYYYNFGGYTGKFMLSTDQAIIRKDKNDLKITSTGIPLDATGVSSFTIKDEKGNTYVFAATEISSMQLDDNTSQDQLSTLSYIYPSSWYLTSITSADTKEQILLNYYTADSAQTQFVNYLSNRSYTYSRASTSTSSYTYDAMVSNNFTIPPTVTIAKRRYLQSITYTKGGITAYVINFGSLLDQRQDLDHVNFPCERMVKDIKVLANNVLVKQYNFFSSYFTNAGYTNADHKRLRLDSVQEAAADGSGAVKPAYAFTYNNNAVPSVGNARIDHWGFYNGADMVATLVPTYSTGDGNTYGGGANRSPGLNSCLTAVLTQMKYPTGGYTQFTYELNQAKNSSGVFDVGGLRIKSITDYSFSNNQATQKNYEYTLNDGSTSGNAPAPIYTKFSSHVNTSLSISYLTVSASSVAGLGTFQGSHVGYSQVTEYEKDISSNFSLGKTVYRYNIGMINADDEDISSGDLLEKTVYDTNGKVLDDEVNAYNYPAGDGGVTGIRVAPSVGQDDKSTLCQTSAGGYNWQDPTDQTSSCVSTRTYKTKYGYSGYALIGQYRQLAMVTKTLYDQLSSSYTTTTRKFTYAANHTLPVLIEQSSSSDDKMVTSKKYAGDYTIPGTGTLDNTTQGIKLLQTNNMGTTEIEICQYRQNNDGSNKRYIGGLLNLYAPASPYLQTIYRLELAAPSATLQVSATNGNFTYDPSYRLLGSFAYDAYGNLNEQSKAQDVSDAYIWDYFHMYPVAEVSNAKAGMIAYCGFESSVAGGNWTGLNGSAVAAGGMAGNNSYNLSTTNSLSMAGLPTSRQYVVSYWVHSGTVSVSSNVGAATATSGAAYNGWTYYEHLLPAGSSSVTVTSSGGANIDELRLFPKDALMATYTYKPGVGQISKCVSINQFMYYTYDGFSRLVNVKDLAGNIVQNIQYNYGLGNPLTAAAQTLFYSATKQGSYQKQGCPVGTEPTTETYVVPAARYASSQNQGDADNKATADVTSNGQNYANTVGQCLYWNTDQSAWFSKNDCGTSGGSSCVTSTGQVRSDVLYDVPAHTYSSLVSLAAANTLALNDVNANGQNYANNYCTCSCTGEGRKMIGGYCERGTRYNSSSTLQSDGTYKCVYYYVFSDGSVSPNYTSYGNPRPCPVQ